MAQEPIASIIITTMNRAELLMRSLASALAQNFKEYEIIVIDDAGTDGTDKAIQPYLKEHTNLFYIRLLHNRGLSYARNYGIMKARGKYVVCLDDDNELLPDFLRETIGEMSRNEGYDAIGVGRIIKYIGFDDYVIPRAGKFCSMDWGILFKRSVFDEIKYDENMKANEDADFGIRFSKMFKAKVIDKYLAVAHDMEDPKLSLSFPSKREMDGITYFLNKNLHEYQRYPNELRYLYRLAGRKFYRGGFKLKGLSYFWKSFMAYPRLNSLVHLIVILFGWRTYDRFMTLTERVAASRRKYA